MLVSKWMEQIIDMDGPALVREFRRRFSTKIWFDSIECSILSAVWKKPLKGIEQRQDQQATIDKIILTHESSNRKPKSEHRIPRRHIVRI